MATEVREPAVAGLFYPDDPAELGAMIDAMLAAAQDRVPSAQSETAESTRALIAPHAGYVYSGPTAAAGYLQVAPLRDRVTRVVVLGPTHRVYVRGLAHPGCESFRTPLGDVPVETIDPELRASLPEIVDSPVAHLQEHSLEVHIPFLQRVIGDFSLLPLAVGDAGPEEVADVLDALGGGEETLIVVSTDLSHYLPYDEARQADSGTIGQILGLDPTIPTERACGARPTNGLLAYATRYGLVPQLVEACNSGDTAGDRGRVVGYASFTVAGAA